MGDRLGTPGAVGFLLALLQSHCVCEKIDTALMECSFVFLPTTGVELLPVTFKLDSNGGVG